MSTRTQNDRIIFGLKVKQLRLEKKLSFKDLSNQTGMSVSYLNEIEKGKKYPKEDKILILAKALQTSFSDLCSPQLSGSLVPVGELLQSNFLNELPLDLFGIELSKVVEIIANSPLRVGAFISTLVDLSRNYALGEENFYFGALRSYLELHLNYFPDIELEVARFVTKFNLPADEVVSVDTLQQLLSEQFGYQIIADGLKDFPELEDIRSVFVPKTKTLLLNSKLNDTQRAFQFGKELGFNYLHLKERANTASLLKVNNFEEALNHFKAGYFSAALLINRDRFVADVKQFFLQKDWNPEHFLGLIRWYKASPEMFFQRLTNVLPEFFGLRQLFFLRVKHDFEANIFAVDKELHLNQPHHPHGNGLSEHYCRRWVSISLLNDLHQMQKEGKYVGTIVGAQRSFYYGTNDEYLCLTVARPSYPKPNYNISVTIGMLVSEQLKAKIKFWNDEKITIREVNQTCERCPIPNCEERAVPPTIIYAKQKRRAIQEALRRITN